MTQMARNAVDEVSGYLRRHRYVLQDLPNMRALLCRVLNECSIECRNDRQIPLLGGLHHCYERAAA